MSEATLNSLLKAVKTFRDERDWGQFHTGKNLAINLCVEGSEVLELYTWTDEISRDQVPILTDELGDVFYTLLLLADTYEVDLATALLNKIQKNSEKYPIERAKGSNQKYNDNLL
ncbi:nucleotide pyrophosphohydrolase [Spirosoma foliorum]|uniref:Nucleotide pyrophosphohydrolase n=1 Tax=Spirosoma foliorum TaxID=2710596 RepID=A0A7G5GPV5_9BACT|nr:nucleotide pyrophosphohydrolase [Spirosoma foliorum]QMW00897.1 nucleotide pyrophosphohydrolase [Spirosoma foliorum]